MFGIVSLIALTMVGVNSVVIKEVRKAILTESLDKGQSIARNLALIAEEAILTMDDTSLFMPLSKTVEESRGIMYAFVTDKTGNIIAHNDVALVDTTRREPESFSEIESGGGFRIITYDSAKGLIYEIGGIVGGVENLGNIHVGITGAIIDDAVENITKSILTLSLLGLLAGAIGAVLLASMQVKPILMLASGVRAIGEGDLEQRVDVRRHDEIGDLAEAFNEMTKGLQEREFIRQTFQKFVHKDVVNQLLENPDMIKVGGEKKKVTIIFTDIRGFTTLSETLNPHDLIGLLNSYFAELLPIIDKNGGVLDKFIGDAMMIVFGTPLAKEDDALRAVKTGLEIQAKVKALNVAREREGRDHITMGIGINTGNVIAGNVGSEDRMEYTVLGDAVNVAARLEGQSRTGDVIISDDTYAEVKDKVVAVKSDEKVALKGKAEAVNIYTVEKLL
jgi:class 3 adenylate cyclase